CLAAGFEPRVGMRMDDYAAINRMISAGVAVAMIPESSLSTDPVIEVIPMPLSACRRDVLLVSRSQRPSSSDSRARHAPIVAALALLPMSLSAWRGRPLRARGPGRLTSPVSRTRHDPIVAARDCAIAEVVADAATVTQRWR